MKLADYRQAKQARPNTILFCRMGDFYETFDADAAVFSKACDIFTMHLPDGTLCCGVPHHALERYITRLVDAGHQVAVLNDTGRR